MMKTEKPNQPLILFFLMYWRLILNFVRSHFSQVTIFSLLATGILFVFFKTYSQDFRTLAELEKISALLVLSLTLVITSFAYPSTAFDKDFLRRNLRDKGVYTLKCLKYFFLSLSIFGVLSFFPLILDLTSIGVLLIGIPILTLVSLFSPIFLPSDKGKTRKAVYQSPILKSGQSLPSSTYSSLCLNIIYFFRRNRRNLIGGLFCILVSYFFIGIYLINVGQLEKVTLFLVPFAMLVLFSLDKNVDIYSNLNHYIAPSLKIAFWSDLIFWNSIFLSQWAVSAAILYSIGFEVFPSFLSILIFFPLIISYGLMLKFKFLKSRILRAFSAGLSVAVPMVIPIFIIMFWLEIKND